MVYSESENAQAEGGSKGIMRWYKRQMKKQAGRMLAIGDGANDVAMIQVRSDALPGTACPDSGTHLHPSACCCDLAST